MSKLFKFLTAFFLASTPMAAHAGNPDSIWATWLQDAAAPVKDHIHHFHNLLLCIITVIVIFVVALLFYTIWRFRRAKNPVASKTTHNVKLEIIWTLIPCFILLIIVVPSLKLMYYMDITNKPDVTLKVTGYQWYWGYSYPDQEIDEYKVNLVPDQSRDPKNEAAALRQLPTYQRLLSTYDQISGKPAFVVVPVQKNVRVLVTADDVIHSFALPAFGIKKDAVPGRLNETWFRAEKPGIYYGQCSEICGVDHGYMPIEIRAVEQKDFDQWAKMMKDDSTKAFDYVQSITVQYAHPQVIAPKMTLPLLWERFEQIWK